MESIVNTAYAASSLVENVIYAELDFLFVNSFSLETTTSFVIVPNCPKYSGWLRRNLSAIESGKPCTCTKFFWIILNLEKDLKSSLVKYGLDERTFVWDSAVDILYEANFNDML